MQAADGDAAGHIVLGFDGGWRMKNLLRAAADEATRRQAVLAIVTVARPALDPALGVSSRQSAERRAENLARRLLSRAAESVLARHQHLSVTTHVLTEEQVRAGSHPLASARLLVVGTVGQHGRSAFSTETVSRMLLNAARCPVLVVPSEGPIGSKVHERQAVIVGVGERPSDAAVIKAGWAESLRRGCRLELFHAYRDRLDKAPAHGLRRAAEAVARAVAAADVALGDRGSVLLDLDDPAAALTRKAGDAQLLVIGSRPGSLSGLVPGSVGLEILSSLTCPLLVIPDPVSDPWSQRPESAAQSVGYGTRGADRSRTTPARGAG